MFCKWKDNVIIAQLQKCICFQSLYTCPAINYSSGLTTALWHGVTISHGVNWQYSSSWCDTCSEMVCSTAMKPPSKINRQMKVENKDDSLKNSLSLREWLGPLLNWAQGWAQDFVELKLKTKFPMTLSVEEFRKYETSFPLISPIIFVKAIVASLCLLHRLTHAKWIFFLE